MATKKKKYQAYVIGKETLIGGRKEHYSIWFDKKQTASDWLSVIKKGNRDAGRKIASSGIRSKVA